MDSEAWISQAREHWRKFQPTTFKELARAGKLHQALNEAVELTHREMAELETAGYSPHEAWEMTMERYLFPPQEKRDAEPNNPWAELHRQAVTYNSQALRLLSGMPDDE